MDIREFLRQHYEIDQAINAKLEQMEELKNFATKITVGIPRESHASGGYADRVGRTAARIVDLENEINDEIDHLIEVKLHIRELISHLPNSIHRTIMERHYILHEGWESISEKMRYTPRHITRLHSQALEILEPIYNASNLGAKT